MRRRLPASASDASREALNSSKQREAPHSRLTDLLYLREDYLRICFQYAAQGEGHLTAIRLKVGCAVIHKSRLSGVSPEAVGSIGCARQRTKPKKAQPSFMRASASALIVARSHDCDMAREIKPIPTHQGSGQSAL